MSLALVAIVLAIGAGAVIAVSTRESIAAPIGLAVALVGAALVTDPLPSAAVVGVRITAALLAATLIRWAARGAPRQFSPLGWPAEALLAAGGAAAGVGIAIGFASIGAGVLIGPGDGFGAGAPGAGAEAEVLTGMALTLAASACLLAVGLAPMLHGKPGIRRAVGAVLVTQAVILFRLAVGGPATDLESIALAALLVAAAARGAALARATGRAAAAAGEGRTSVEAALERSTGLRVSEP